MPVIKLKVIVDQKSMAESRILYQYLNWGDKIVLRDFLIAKKYY